MKKKTEANQEDKDVKVPYLRKMVLAFVLATIILVGVFFAGYSMSHYKYREVTQSQEGLRYSLLSFEIERELAEDSCEAFDPYLFTEEMDNMGSVIGILENRLGKRNQAILNQKRTYSLLEARHLIYVRDHNNRCDNKVPIIIFFYSNIKPYQEESERLGFMLSTLKKSENVMIYSFDSDLEASFLSILKKKYGVEEPNTLIVNKKLLTSPPKNIDELKAILADNQIQ